MIGLFDSGSGGLSVLTALRKRAPRADVAYFGDIAHAPYGVRSPEELVELSRTGIKILKDMGAKEIVSACNSVSQSVLAGVAGDLPIIEMTKPTAKYMRSYAGKRVLLIATSATVNAGIYKKALADVCALDSLPIPELAGAIEFGASEGEVRKIIHDAFQSRRNDQYDCILLGCTHYPLVRELIESEAAVFGSVEIIDPAEAVAEEVIQRFNTEGSGTTRFLISKDSDTFRKRVSELFSPSSYTIDLV